MASPFHGKNEMKPHTWRKLKSTHSPCCCVFKSNITSQIIWNK